MKIIDRNNFYKLLDSNSISDLFKYSSLTLKDAGINIAKDDEVRFFEMLPLQLALNIKYLKNGYFLFLEIYKSEYCDEIIQTVDYYVLKTHVINIITDIMIYRTGDKSLITNKMTMQVFFQSLVEIFCDLKIEYNKITTLKMIGKFQSRADKLENTVNRYHKLYDDYVSLNFFLRLYKAIKYCIKPNILWI